MCGLVGLVGGRSGSADASSVRRAVGLLAHRGPDGAGEYHEAEGEAWLERAGNRGALPSPGNGVRLPITIAHRRLAVIDRSSDGAQPFASRDGRWILAWNGELYNYLELRAELARAGLPARTASDSEVLLLAWSLWGPRALDRFVGMYALAVVDRMSGTLWLVRDPFGQKPLYTARTSSGLVFASELPALLEVSGIRARASAPSLAAFLAAGLTDRGGETMFAGLDAVPPAHMLTVDLTGSVPPRLSRTWGGKLGVADDRPAAELATELRALLEESVRWHLRSDVPVGVMLSGGTDSSSITALARLAMGASAPLATFSYRPDGEAASEAPWMDIVNAAAGTASHPVRPTLGDVDAHFVDVVARQGEPIASPAVFVQSMICREAAAQGVIVLLDGQGSDELLGGYAFARAARLAGHLRRGELRALRALSRSMAAAGHRSEVRSALAMLGARQITRWRVWRGASPFGALTDAAWMRQREVTPLEPWAPRGPQVVQEQQREGAEVSSVPALMRYADRSAMGASIEGRHPFLTTRIAEFALRLPDSAIVADDGSSKPLLRQAMRGVVPDAILDRRDKVGFAVPWKPWLAGSRVVQQLLETGSRLPGVDARAATRLILTLRAGAPMRGHEVAAAWRIASLAAWASAYDVRFD